LSFGAAYGRLYQKYMGKAFVPKMKQILSAGGSYLLTEIAKIAGYDITANDFWRIGIRRYKLFLKQLEEIAKWKTKEGPSNLSIGKLLKSAVEMMV